MNKKIEAEIKTYIEELEKQPLRSFSKNEEVITIPHERGVYIIYNPKGNPIYVGCSGDLDRRVRNQLFSYDKKTEWFSHPLTCKLSWEFGNWIEDGSSDEDIEKAMNFLKTCSFRFIIIKEKYIMRIVELQLIKKLTENNMTPEFNFIVHPTEKEDYP